MAVVSLIGYDEAKSGKVAVREVVIQIVEVLLRRAALGAGGEGFEGDQRVMLALISTVDGTCADGVRVEVGHVGCGLVTITGSEKALSRGRVVLRVHLVIESSALEEVDNSVCVVNVVAAISVVAVHRGRSSGAAHVCLARVEVGTGNHRPVCKGKNKQAERLLNQKKISKQNRN